VKLTEMNVLPLRQAIVAVVHPFTVGLYMAASFVTFGQESHAAEAKKWETTALQKLAALSPEAQQLVWLQWLLLWWGPEDCGLHIFFKLTGAHAAEVHGALVAAGLPHRAEVFARAMAMFGDSYPPARMKLLVEGLRSDALEEQLEALARAFGGREGYTRDVDAYVARTPGLLEWMRNAVALLPDKDRLRCLTDQLRRAAYQEPEGVAAWPRVYQLVHLLDLFEREMLNGGVHQFFYNESGDRAPEVVVALREVGLSTHADAVSRGVASFGDPYPAENEARRAHLARARAANGGEWSGFDERLDALTGEVDDGAVSAVMLKVATDADVLPR
jgi:hypothetical protein